MKMFKTDPLNIQLSEKSDSEEGNLKSVQLMRAGVFSYYDKDDMVIDASVFNQMIINFNNKLRGIDLAIDYGHNSHEEAAGWIKKLYTTEDQTQLWAEVDFTPSGLKKIQDKEYRYLSVEYSDYYYQDEVDHGVTLYGAALTNRPFIKKMEPVTSLDEIKKQEELKMKEQLEALLKSFNELNEKFSNVEKKLSELENKKEVPKKEEEKKELSEVEKSELNKKFDRLLMSGECVEAQRVAYMEGDVKKFNDLKSELNLSPKGTSEEKNLDKKFELMSSEEAEDKILELAQDEMKNSKLPLKEAVTAVLKKNKVLAEKYKKKFDF